MAEALTFSFNPKVGDLLTKEDILAKVSEEEIFAFYGCPLKKGLFCSPLRTDKNPTCGLLKLRDGSVLYKDFGTGAALSCWSFVATKFGVTYQRALNIIATDFGLIKSPTIIKNKPVYEYKGEKIEEHTSAVIQVEIRPFSYIDLKWWKTFGISENTLRFYKVFACKNVWLNGNLFALEPKRMFGYFGGIKGNKELWKIYQPGKTKFKFIGNYPGTKLQGARQLPKDGGDFVVCTKALKDVMVLHEYGIPAIAPSSETSFLTKEQYDKLKSKFKTIVVLYDNDYTGITRMNKIRKEFDVLPLWLPRNKAKDLSDFRRDYGDKATKELINNTLQKYGYKCI